ncbi:MAG: metal ABC transporter permease, partial [Armatimonadetes bacterium]|nr:metal ABC transporter permease [Armatimonadota bacterium]
MNELLGYFQYDFARTALLAGLIVSLLGALVGFFVVLRRMAFVAVGVSHAALGGVALGVLFGQSPILWAVGFSIVVALAMAALGQRGVAEDTAMGVFFPAAMAFGVVVISYSEGWRRDLLSYLFGNILAVTSEDLWVLGGVGLVVAVLVAVYFKELLFISFDEESAHAAGVPVARMRTLLLVLTAVTVVISMKVVGTVLVSAMLVIPTATAAQLTSRWQWLLLGSVLVAVSSILAGLLISFTNNVATGPAAVL